ncbi:hypothetical protein BDW22DRAFT_1486624 [Trametopsis cervina]|nr:hypothetical protein BDW22DRAFT_1486624 [Trametopsis cervina]
MTTLLRGLLSFKRNLAVAVPKTVSSNSTTQTTQRCHAFVNARRFCQSARRSEEEDAGKPAVKAVAFPDLPLERRLSSPTEKSLDVERKIYSTTALPDTHKTLPPIPPRPPPGSTPWLSDDDAATYLPPLFERQWSVARYRPPDVKRAKITYQLLSKVFVFKSVKDALEFSMEITQIANKMAHHPTIHKVVGTMVIFRTLTHSAHVVPFHLWKLLKPVSVPGITMHDVRLAMRLERAWGTLWDSHRAALPRKGWSFPGLKRPRIISRGRIQAKVGRYWKYEVRVVRWLARAAREKAQAEQKRAGLARERVARDPWAVRGEKERRLGAVWEWGRRVEGMGEKERMREVERMEEVEKKERERKKQYWRWKRKVWGKTPRWKKMKWKNRARDAKRAERRAQYQAAASA